MSRSGRIPINIPESTEVKVESGIVYAKGKLGELEYNFQDNALVKLDGSKIEINPKDDSKFSGKMWGTVRSRIFNIVEGVTTGFTKELQLNGVGYKAALKGNILEFQWAYDQYKQMLKGIASHFKLQLKFIQFDLKRSWFYFIN